MIRLRAREAHAPVADTLQVTAEHLGRKVPGERRLLGPGVLVVNNGLPLLIPAVSAPVGAPPTPM